MEGVPAEPVPDTEQVYSTLTSEGVDLPAAPPSINDLPEGFATMHNLAQDTDLDAEGSAQVRDIASYLGLEPMVVRGAGNNLIQTFSPAAAKTLTDFVREQTRPSDELTLGESNG